MSNYDYKDYPLIFDVIHSYDPGAFELACFWLDREIRTGLRADARLLTQGRGIYKSLKISIQTRCKLEQGLRHNAAVVIIKPFPNPYLSHMRLIVSSQISQSNRAKQILYVQGDRNPAPDLAACHW